MSSDWKNSVNQTLGPARISDLCKYVDPSYLQEDYSPIDRFYLSTQELLKISTPEFIEKNSLLGPLILVGFVSATENYFREIFSQLIHICPIAKNKSTEKKINIASALWYGKNFVARGAFEDFSFASASTITKTCSEYLGHNLKCAKKEDSIFNEFDKICELRHCIVHCNSIIGGKNAIKLGLKNEDDKAIKVSIDYSKLQECGLICTSLVTSVNTELFELIVRRWAIEWTKLPSWNPKDEFILFKKIWDLFYSYIDFQNNSIVCELSIRQCRNRAKQFYK